MSHDTPDGWTPQEAAQKPLCSELPAPAHHCWPLVRDYLGDRGLDSEVARENGWYASQEAGDGYVRVVIPCISMLAGNLYWQARAVEWGGKVEPRYQSPHGRRRGDAIVYVCPPFVGKKVKGTVFAEGPMDALAAACIGYIGIAWMGMKPPDEAIKTASLMWVQPGFVVADEGDDAFKAATRIWQRFLGTKLIKTYPFKDLAEAPPEAREELLQ